jgi:ATP-dependent protease ClpP protease subunit
MKLSLSGDVNSRMLNKLVEAINERPENEKLSIYFTTPGGLVSVSDAIIDVINTTKNIEMIFYGEIFSAGMIIFLKTKCKKRVLKEIAGMYHYCFQALTINEGGKPSGPYDSFIVKDMKESRTRTAEYLKTTKLTDKEITQIKAGKDVFFTYERMLELL